MKYYNTIWLYNLTGEISLHNSTLTHNIDDNHDSNSYNIKTTMTIMIIIFFFFFLRGHGNESCNLIGSYHGPYFPISAHGQR